MRPLFTIHALTPIRRHLCIEPLSVSGLLRPYPDADDDILYEMING